jgi:hypothetical protein
MERPGSATRAGGPGLHSILAVAVCADISANALLVVLDSHTSVPCCS